MTGEYSYKHKPEVVPLDEWSVEKDGEFTAEDIETITAFGQAIRGIWKNKNYKTLIYTSVDSTSVEQQTELHDGAGPFASESGGETVQVLFKLDR